MLEYCLFYYLEMLVYFFFMFRDVFNLFYFFGLWWSDLVVVCGHKGVRGVPFPEGGSLWRGRKCGPVAIVSVPVELNGRSFSLFP